MLSCVYNGKVLDFHYKKLSDRCYNFSIGDIFIGQIFKMRKHNWYAVSWYENARGSRFSMGGFGSRYHASEYLLKINGFHK